MADNNAGSAKKESDGKHQAPVAMPPSVSTNHKGKGREGQHYA